MNGMNSAERAMLILIVIAVMVLWDALSNANSDRQFCKEQKATETTVEGGWHGCEWK